MAKLPSLQFYPGDWRKDPGVQALTYEERGVWFEMLLLMFESGERGKLLLNGKKMPDSALARTLGLDNQKSNQIVSKLIDYGVAKVEEQTNIIYCSRMVKDECFRKIRSDSGKKGGNPDLLKQNGSKNEFKSENKVNQIPTPSSSVSSSSSTTLKHNITREENISEKGKVLSPQEYKKFKRRFETALGIYLNSTGKEMARKSFMARSRSFGIDYYRELVFAIGCERKTQHNAIREGRSRHPPNVSTFFESGYKDYQKNFKNRKMPETYKKPRKL